MSQAIRYETIRPTAADSPEAKRSVSVDVLRGFDMFWIIGAEKIAEALGRIDDGPVTSAIATQLKHAEWEGLRFYDLVFPLFLFLVGVSIELSIGRTLVKSGRSAALVRIARRTLLLFAVGVFYYGGFERAWPDVALTGVLPRIAITYGIAATLYVLLSRRGILIAAAFCLFSYWAAMNFVPYPDVHFAHPKLNREESQSTARPPSDILAATTRTTRGTFDEGHNLAHYVDLRLMPGRQRNLYYSNEGLLSTIPAVTSVLFGIMAGWLLVDRRRTGRQKVAWLFAAGALAILAGLLWSVNFPIIKRIWTSSYCLIAAGFSAIFLAGFYFVLDVKRWQKGFAPFLWLGANSLAVYLAANLFDFDAIAARFVGGDLKGFFDRILTPGSGDLILATVSLALPLALARYLYQRKIFIRL